MKVKMPIQHYNLDKYKFKYKYKDECTTSLQIMTAKQFIYQRSPVMIRFQCNLSSFATNHNGCAIKPQTIVYFQLTVIACMVFILFHV